MSFTTTLRRILDSVADVSIDFYDMERFYIGNSPEDPITVSLADETDWDFLNQDVTIDDFGCGEITDTDGDVHEIQGLVTTHRPMTEADL